MKTTYLLNGITVEPVNRGEIFVEVNHDQQALINQPIPNVGINNIRFAREDVAKIMAILNQPPGITEGIPFDIKMEERGKTEILRLYLDVMDGFEKSRDGINVSVKMQHSLDWLEDKWHSFTHESMYYETGVKPFIIDGVSYPDYKTFFDQRCVYVPYVISTIPNWQDAFMAMFAITYIGTELYKVLKSILQWVSPQVGFGATVGVAQLVAEIVFSALLIITLIGLLTQLINCLIQPVKYHASMLVTDLLKVTAAKLGLQFQSSIWNTAPLNQIAYMPEKYSSVEASGGKLNILGFLATGFGTFGYTSPSINQKGYYDGTGGDFLGFVRSICNGKFIIPDGTSTLILERRDYSIPNTPYELPDIRQDWHSYNTDELNATTIITFARDLNDKNSIDKYQGTILQATHQQVITIDPQRVCLKGLREINIYAARGVNKTKLTFIEQVVKDLEKIWDDVEDFFIPVVNVAIDATNIIIQFVINPLINIWNLLLKVVQAIIKVLNVVIDAVNSLGFNIPNIPDFTEYVQLDTLSPISHISKNGIDKNDFNDRINALLLENDIVDVPKLLLIDTARSEYINNRIGYLNANNLSVINAQYLWDYYYKIDAFVGAINNRYTKITPALNDPSERNRCTLSLADFLNLVSNPEFRDNFGEPVKADSIQWFVEQNGAAEFTYRKAGWLRDPQNVDMNKRLEEININLKIQTSLPDGR